MRITKRAEANNEFPPLKDRLGAVAERPPPTYQLARAKRRETASTPRDSATVHGGNRGPSRLTPGIFRPLVPLTTEDGAEDWQWIFDA